MRIITVVGVLWLLVVVVLASDAGMSVVGFCFVLLGGATLGVVWLGGAVAVQAKQRRSGDPARFHRSWGIVPICLAVAVAITASDGPRSPLFRARFRASERALTREADRLLASPDPTARARGRVGLFLVRSSTVVDGQVRLITTSCGVVDSCGLVFSPRTSPTRWQEDVFVSLRGRWWHLYEGF